MPDIQELIRDATDSVEAPPHDRLTGRVRTGLRRRRAARFAGTGVAAAAVLAVGVGAGTGYLPVTGGSTQVDTASPGQAPKLPDSAVGKAQWLTFSMDEPQLWLTTTDGTRYRVPGSSPASKKDTPLSQDGRWVVYREGKWLVVRDLTGTTTYRFDHKENTHAVAWSANGRWLVLRRSHGKTYDPTQQGVITPEGKFGQLIRLDLKTGDIEKWRPSEKSDKPGGLARVAGVLPSGEVLVAANWLDSDDSRPPRRTDVTYRVVDPTDGSVQRSFTVPDAANWKTVPVGDHVPSTPDENGDAPGTKVMLRVTTQPITIAPDGRHGVVAEGSTMRMVDLHTGHSTAFDLADVHGYHKPDGVSEWQPVSLQDGRLTLVCRTDDKGFPRLVIDLGSRRVVSQTDLGHPAYSWVPSQVTP